MRATLAWIFALAAGSAAFMSVAILALLPIEAAKNRVVYGVVEQYAHRLAAAQRLPHNTALDDDFGPIIKGIRVWPALPGSCSDVAFEGPSDRFVVGFWENGSRSSFGAMWWHCYAYPSNNTTLQLSVSDYLRGPAGWQVATYALIAAIAGYVARLLGSRGNNSSLKPLAKAAWFGASMTILSVIWMLDDFGDDEFWQSQDYVKWFVIVFSNSVGSLYEIMSASLKYVSFNPLEDATGMSLTFFAFILWSIVGRVAGRLITLGRERLRSA